MAIGGGLLAIVLAVFLAMRGPSGGDPESRALAALADTTGAAHATTHAQREEVPLPDSSVARLGADAPIRLNAGFGEQRFLTAGGIAAFSSDAAGLVYVHVDSGDVVVVRDSTRGAARAREFCAHRKRRTNAADAR